MLLCKRLEDTVPGREAAREKASVFQILMAIAKLPSNSGPTYTPTKRERFLPAIVLASLIRQVTTIVQLDFYFNQFYCYMI